MPATHTFRSTRMLLSVVTAGSLFLAACSDSGSETSSGASDETTEEAGTTTGETSMGETGTTTGASGSMTSTAAPFGDGCATVPEEGAGSFDGMAQDPVATAASNNPVLSTLVQAVGEAGLVDTLNGAGQITVFAPTNDAFAALPKKTLNGAMADPSGLLTTVLTYPVIGERLAPEDLAGELETLQGSTLEVEGSVESFTVNGEAAVICGNVQTANATVYIIDEVLLPPASA